MKFGLHCSSAQILFKQAFIRHWNIEDKEGTGSKKVPWIGSFTTVFGKSEHYIFLKKIKVYNHFPKGEIMATSTCRYCSGLMAPLSHKYQVRI